MFFKVVDLLVSMCRSALESPRKVVIFEPYPSVVDPNDPQMLAFNPRVSGQPQPPNPELLRIRMETAFPLNVCLVECIHGKLKVMSYVWGFCNLLRI